MNHYKKIAIIFVFIGFLLNPPFLTILFSKDGSLLFITKLKIVIFEIINLLLGIIFYNFSKLKKLTFADFKKSNIFNAILVVVTVFSILIFVEFCSYLVMKSKSLFNSSTDKFEFKSSESFYNYNSNFGFKPPAKKKITLKKQREYMVYDVSYHFDEYGRRKTSVSSKVAKNKYVIFFGCSVTFGEGLNDEDTIPYLI